MKFPAVLCVTALVLFSCQKEAEPDTIIPEVPSSSSCKVVSAYLYDDTNPNRIEDSAKYEYTNGRLTKLLEDTSDYETFTYTNGRITKRDLYQVGSATPNQSYVFNWANDTTLSSIEDFIIFGTSSVKNDSTSFQYTGGHLTAIRNYNNYSGNGAPLQLWREFLYTYTGNNISRQVFNNYNSGIFINSDTVTMTYDNLSNYFQKQSKNILLSDPFWLRTDIDYYALFLSANNVLNIRNTMGSRNENWTYTADAKGNLTEVRLQGAPAIKYNYQCQ